MQLRSKIKGSILLSPTWPRALRSDVPPLNPRGEALIDAHGNGTIDGAVAGMPCLPREVSFLKVKPEIHPAPLPVLTDFLCKPSLF